MRQSFSALVVCALVLSGCANGWERNGGPSAPPGGTGISADGAIVKGPDAVSSISQISPRGAASEPAFTAKGVAAAYEFNTGYKVGAGDRLTVKVAGETDLTADYLVDAGGNISMPYVQSVPVAGMTTQQIEQLLTRRLREGYLRNPQVSVQATALRPFYILGEVTTSGSYAYQPGMTVQNAIAIAGGYSPRADRAQVLITRRNDQGTSTVKGPLTTQIYPGDVIFVRERWF